MSETVRTAFDAPQRALGGDLVEWEGWFWPNTFGDAIAEHHAVRTDVGVWDASPLRKWRFEGPDALRAADRVFTNDMAGLELGQVRYAPFCDDNGKMVGDGTVFRFSDTYVLVVTALDSDLEHMKRVTDGLDVELTPQTKEMPHIGLNGPRSRELLQSLTEADVSALRYFRFWPEEVEIGGVPCWVSRTGYSGELGFEVFCRPDGAEQLWAAVTDAGARPYGLAAVETLRIESGLVFIGYDYFPGETSPYDVGLDAMVDLGAGDFHGKAALAAEAASPANRFVTLVVDGPVPEYGAAVTRDGEQVGTLTSPCESPTLEQVIGLTVLRADLANEGERVEVTVEGGTAPATVASLPIYDPGKKRPRA